MEVLPNGHYLDVPTEAELRTYQYIYDFSTYPPRPRAIRKSGEVPSCNPVTSPATFVLLPDTSALGKTQSVTENSENSSNTSNTRIQGELNASNSVNASPTPSRYCRVQLAGKGFDPYAPNRTYERKRAALSQDMEAIFDREPNQSLISHQNPYNNIYPSSPNTMPTLSAPALSQPATAKPTIIAQNPAPTTGWQVIATPSHASTLSPQPLTVAEVAPTPASVNAAVGTQVTLPSEKKASQFPPITSETIQREIPYTTFPNSNDAINILDLPER
ncbi:MAG: hypothetical protein Q4C70_13355 [Planctomycetia bacterium]|nr:hypothetical protein [Planctomycetia bacterium]